jgi:hypothetical protein
MSANREQNQQLEELSKRITALQKQMAQSDEAEFRLLRQIAYNQEQMYAACFYFPLIWLWRKIASAWERLWPKVKALFPKKKEEPKKEEEKKAEAKP